MSYKTFNFGVEILILKTKLECQKEIWNKLEPYFIENSYAAIEYTLTVKIVPSVQQRLSLLMVPTILVENSFFFQLFFQLF